MISVWLGRRVFCIHHTTVKPWMCMWHYSYQDLCWTFCSLVDTFCLVVPAVAFIQHHIMSWETSAKNKNVRSPYAMNWYRSLLYTLLSSLCSGDERGRNGIVGLVTLNIHINCAKGAAAQWLELCGDKHRVWQWWTPVCFPGLWHREKSFCIQLAKFEIYLTLISSDIGAVISAGWRSSWLKHRLYRHNLSVPFQSIDNHSQECRLLCHCFYPPMCMDYKFLHWSENVTKRKRTLKGSEVGENNDVRYAWVKYPLVYSCFSVAVHPGILCISRHGGNIVALLQRLFMVCLCLLRCQMAWVC